MDIERKKVWIDCDPGTDDAAALLCAHALPELEILGISTQSGNVEPEKTFRNALRLNRLLGADYPVFAGADRPWVREPGYGYRFHGENGLGGVELPLPEHPVPPGEKAWEAIRRAAAEHPGELELICTGPLTNCATALTLFPELRTLLRRIILMGGAAVGGNRTPAAEFNIWSDPEAAKAVFTAGVPLVMCGLDVTNRSYLTAEELEALGRVGNAAGCFLSRCLRTPLEANGVGRVCLHDVVAVLWAARPALFSGRMAWVGVETRGTITNGKTVTDLWSDRKGPAQNAFVLLDVDRPAFVRTVTELVARCP